MLQNIEKYDRCANCGACYNICPQNAIFVESNGMYYQPKVDRAKCIECGLCLKKCPVNERQTDNEFHPIEAYAGTHRDKKTVMQSSSGGFFTAIAEQVLASGGVVFGAVYTEDCKQVIIGSTEQYSLDQIRRSKYVESNVGFQFREIKKHLEQERKVLFCGTPCQVAGLNAYLGKQYDNLITCDFACGGLPSHKVFETYLEELQKKKKANGVKEVNFRPKIFGWRIHAITVSFTNRKTYKNLASSDPYFYAFVLDRTLQREYCYSCDFSDHHESDIILADFWMFFKVGSFKEPFDGLSLVISNSQKGQKMLEDITDRVSFTELPLEEACYNIKETISSPEQMEKREKYLENFEKSGVFYASTQDGMITGFKAFQAKCKARAKSWIRRLQDLR